MPALEAICTKCGTSFPSGFFLGEGVSGAQFAGNLSGPCPKCGSMGRIPDGTYGVADGLIRFLGSGAEAKDRWYLLNDLVQTAKVSNWDAAQFRKQAAARSPAAAQLLDFLPESKSEWYGFLSLLIATLALLQVFFGVTHTDPTPPLTQEQIAQAVTQGVLEAQKLSTAAETAHAPAHQSIHAKSRPFGRKVGRNESCPCGSGKKYKRCHG